MKPNLASEIRVPLLELLDPEPPFASNCFEAGQVNVERLRCAYSGSFILRRSAS